MSLEEINARWQENSNLMPEIEKVVVNISVGKSGEPLEKAMKILQELTGQKPCVRSAKKTIRDFGIRKKEPVACIVTLRRDKAKVFLKRILQTVDNKISGRTFDKYGNFSFGLKEHISIPGTKYSPELGIVGMDVTVVLSRSGYRVKQRHRAKSKMGSGHLLTRDEAKLFMSNMFGVEIS